MPEWLIVAIKEYLFVKVSSSSTVMETLRSLFDSLWVQLKKVSFLTSWPPWLENRQSWKQEKKPQDAMNLNQIWKVIAIKKAGNE